MPQGKGTYGSQVGRPSKKAKYQYGGSVDPFSTRNPEGVPATKVMKALDDKNQIEQGIPVQNAQERSQTSPDTEKYGKGGKIKEEIRTRVQDVRHRIGEKSEKRKKAKAKAKESKAREKARKKSVKDYPITGIAKPKPKAGKAKEPLGPVKVPSNPPFFEGDTAKEKFLNQSTLYKMGKAAGKKGKKK